MSRDNHTEEMHLTESEVLANDIAQMCPDLVNSGCGDLSCVTYLAKGLEQIGYRKSTDVAREIFEEISKASADWGCYCISAFKWGYVTSDVSHTLSELKKKYIEKDTKDDGLPFKEV